MEAVPVTPRHRPSGGERRPIACPDANLVRPSTATGGISATAGYATAIPTLHANGVRCRRAPPILPRAAPRARHGRSGLGSGETPKTEPVAAYDDVVPEHAIPVRAEQQPHPRGLRRRGFARKAQEDDAYSRLA